MQVLDSDRFKTDHRAVLAVHLWKSAVFQRGHFSLSVCLIFPVVGRASCA